MTDQNKSDPIENAIKAARSNKFSDRFTTRVMTQILEEEKLDHLLPQALECQFNPAFEERVMQQVRKIAHPETEPETAIAQMILRLFPRVSIPAAAIASLAIIINISSVNPDASVIDKLFGWPASQNTEITYLLWEAS
jgi:hypothetical protein